MPTFPLSRSLTASYWKLNSRDCTKLSLCRSSPTKRGGFACIMGSASHDKVPLALAMTFHVSLQRCSSTQSYCIHMLMERGINLIWTSGHSTTCPCSVYFSTSMSNSMRQWTSLTRSITRWSLICLLKAFSNRWFKWMDRSASRLKLLCSLICKLRTSCQHSISDHYLSAPNKTYFGISLAKKSTARTRIEIIKSKTQIAKPIIKIPMIR